MTPLGRDGNADSKGEIRHHPGDGSHGRPGAGRAPHKIALTRDIPPIDRAASYDWRVSAAGVVEVSAVVLRNASGALLTVRKRGTARFMLPGGKPEPGESAQATAVRECREELGVDLAPGDLRRLGSFRAAAANEPELDVVAEVFEHPAAAGLAPSGEIAELRWLDVDARPLPIDLAPLVADHVLPAIGRTTGRVLPRSVTLFTGSAGGARPVYAEAIAELARAFADRGIRLVYGGGHVGLMGCVADAALAAGGHVTGVMPQALVDGEIAHTGLTALEVVADMHARKLRMSELGEAFVALPGGAGTLEEFFEVWTWQQLGIHDKPVALYDIDGFWQPLLTMINNLVEEGFLAARYRDGLIVVRTPDELFDAWSRWNAPRSKWSSS